MPGCGRAMQEYNRGKAMSKVVKKCEAAMAQKVVQECRDMSSNAKMQVQNPR